MPHRRPFTVRLRAVRFRAVRVAAAILAIGSASSAARGEDAPPDAAAHFDRAAAALEAKNPAAAWWHARQAVRADPSHAESVSMFQAMWLAIDAQGFVNVGRGPDEIVSDLGPADERAARGGSLRLAYGFMALDFADGKLTSTIDLRGLTAAAVRPRETLVPEHDERAWRIGARQINRIQVNTEYVLEDDWSKDWTELLSVQRMVGLAERDIALTAFADGMREAFEAHAAHGTWRILRKSDDELVYEFLVPAGDAAPQQHEIARLVRGRHDIHRVSYTKKGGAMPGPTRDAWLRRLAGAELREVPAARSASAQDAGRP